MRKIVLSFIMVFFIAFLTSSAQTLVLPGENALSSAIANAQDGDVLQLISGGVYTETASPVGVIDKKITIELENYTSGLAKAQVYFSSLEDGDGDLFFALQDGADITLRGIEFDGTVDGGTLVEYLMQADITDLQVETWINKIVLEDLYVHNLNDNMVDAGNSDMKTLVVFDSTFVNNCVVHDIATSLYYKYSGENYIEVTNSTFYRLTSYGVRIAGPGESGDYDHTATGFVDHITMYDVGSLDGREMILVEKGPNLNPWTVQNSIFQLQHNKDKTVINLKDLPDNISTVQNICYWDVGDRNWRNNVVQDTLNADPEFADPDNGDFTLPEGSQLYTFGTDGGAIGDPRWAIYPSAVEKEEGIPTEFALMQNYPNPFNPSTNIKFTLIEAGFTTLKVFDILGRQVDILVSKQLTPGVYSYNFDATNLPSGVYIYQLTSDNLKVAKKMLLNK